MAINSYAELKEKKEELVGVLVRTGEAIDKLQEIGIVVEGQVILDLIEKLKNDNFRVLVIGEFKNGKSTFINSLMGAKVLPAYSTPCTAVINEVKYGYDKKATLYFKQPLPDEISLDIQPDAMQHIMKHKNTNEIPPFELNVDELEDYVAIPDPSKDQADSIKKLPYGKVVLEYPLDLCKNGIEIIDSPGLNENQTRTKVTEEYLKEADAIIFVFRCPKIASTTEMDYVSDQIRTRGHEDIFFVCNCINLVPEEEKERLIKFGNKKLLPYTSLGQSGIFYVNALGALKARQEKNQEALNETGMLEFERALSEYLTNNKGKTKLLQIITPLNMYLANVETQHIQGYIASLQQDMVVLEKKIEEAMPNLKLAMDRKDIISQKISLAMDNLKKEVANLMACQYDLFSSKIQKFIDELDLDNHMTINPFKQKKDKEALENEVITKVDEFVQKEMGAWIKTDLNTHIERFMSELENDIGRDIDDFYNYLDDFRYEVTGIKKQEDISGMGRVVGTILGTIIGGPTYGVLGATMGFGEIAKRSAITLGVSALAGAALAFTPIGIAAILSSATIALTGAGILQIITGGKSLTEKYKNALKKQFVKKLKQDKEKSSNDYAEKVVTGVNEKMSLINQALDNEIAIEQGKIDELKEDKKNGEAERKQKVVALQNVSEELNTIRKQMLKIKEEIDKEV